MGLLCDYFVAADDATAAGALDIVGGPGGSIPLPMPFAELVRVHGRDGAMAFFKPRVRWSEHGFEVVSTKNFNPFDDLATVEAALTGEAWEDVWGRLPEPVAMLGEGECLVLPLGERTRAVLAGASEGDLSAAAEAWNAAEAGRASDPGALGDLLGELGALARGAGERGERMYCWVCL